MVFLGFASKRFFFQGFGWFSDAKVGFPNVLMGFSMHNDDRMLILKISPVWRSADLKLHALPTSAMMPLGSSVCVGTLTYSRAPCAKGYCRICGNSSSDVFSHERLIQSR